MTTTDDESGTYELPDVNLNNDYYVLDPSLVCAMIRRLQQDASHIWDALTTRKTKTAGISARTTGSVIVRIHPVGFDRVYYAYNFALQIYSLTMDLPFVVKGVCEHRRMPCHFEIECIVRPLTTLAKPLTRGQTAIVKAIDYFRALPRLDVPEIAMLRFFQGGVDLSHDFVTNFKDVPLEKWYPSASDSAP